MSFNKVQSLDSLVKGINLYPGSSPASVVFRDTLYVFYAGLGFDGIWCTSTRDGLTWAPIYNLNDKGARGSIGIAKGTSPAVAVYRDTLWLFFNGSGNDSVYNTKFDGTNWTAAAKSDIRNRYDTFLPKTSPSAAVCKDVLYLFYCIPLPSDQPASMCSIVFDFLDGTNWSGNVWEGDDTGFWPGSQPVRNIRANTGTSPSAVTLNNTLYLFYNGGGNDGTWYTKLVDPQSRKFTLEVQVAKGNGGMTFRPQTSPNTLVLVEDLILRLFWVDKSSQAIYYSDYRVNDDKWSSQKKLTCDGDVPGLSPNTAPTSVLFQQRPYLFWFKSSGTGINFSPCFVWEISASGWTRFAQSLQDGESFVMTASDLPLAAFLSAKLGNGDVDTPLTFISDRISSDVPWFLRNAWSNFDLNDGVLATRASVATTLIVSAMGLNYQIMSNFRNKKATIRFYYKG